MIKIYTNNNTYITYKQPHLSKLIKDIIWTPTLLNINGWRNSITPRSIRIMLERIATYKEETESLKKKIKKALFYTNSVP